MKEIKRYLDGRMGKYSFYFEDINGEYTYGFNENDLMTAASCIKLPIATALLKEIEKDNIKMQDKMFISNSDMVDGNGILHEFGEREYTIEELLRVMLIQSDNTAANKIIDLLTIGKINESIRAMGLKNTVLNRKMRDLEAINQGKENYTTSYDLSKWYENVYNNNYLNKTYSKQLLNILKRQQIKDKIPFYIPMDQSKHIANKTGSLDKIENDSALLNIEKGDFVFTVMSKELPNNIYGVVTIARVGKMMWDIINKDWK